MCAFSDNEDVRLLLSLLSLLELVLPLLASLQLVYYFILLLLEVVDGVVLFVSP